MKKTLLTLFTFTFSLFTLSAQSWLWARQGKNPQPWGISAFNIAIDNLHNAYLAGAYSGIDTLSFNSDTLLANSSISSQAYLVKYDENGNMLWARSSQTSLNGQAQFVSVATDRNNNAYATGAFMDTAYFQSFVLEDTYITRKTNWNALLVKYDENGNVKWAKQSTNNGDGAVNSGRAIVTDKSGNIYIAGDFNDTVSFGSITLRCPSGETFLVKYDSSGNVLWAKQSIGSINSGASIPNNAISIDKWGYIYVTGNFTDTVTFGSQKLTTSNNGDAFIVKYDDNGNIVWAREAGTIHNQNNASSAGICTDKQGNVYVDGYFADTMGFGANTLIGPNDPYYSDDAIFWAKYDSAGNLLWAKQSHVLDLDTAEWISYAINTDASENLYITGSRNALYFDKVKVIFDSDTLQLSKSRDPFFFIKMDSSGSVLNSSIFDCDEGTTPALAVDSSGCYVYYGGLVDTTVVLGKDTLGTAVNPHAHVSPFIARWSPGECTTGINTIENPNITFDVYPNPTNRFLNLNFNKQPDGPSTLSIMDITGRTVYNSQLIIDNSFQRNPLRQFTIDVSSFSPGMYFIQIKNNDTYVTQKFIKL